MKGVPLRPIVEDQPKFLNDPRDDRIPLKETEWTAQICLRPAMVRKRWNTLGRSRQMNQSKTETAQSATPE